MNKLFLVLLLFFYSVINVSADEIPGSDMIILTEKIDNSLPDKPETPHKSDISYLIVYQSGNVFYFGESYTGCQVSLISNEVTVYGTVVDPHGFVTIPAPVTGSFEMEATVNDVIYWAEIQL